MKTSVQVGLQGTTGRCGKPQQSHGNDGLCPVGQLVICFNLDEKKEPLSSETNELTSQSMVSELTVNSSATNQRFAVARGTAVGQETLQQATTALNIVYQHLCY